MNLTHYLLVDLGNTRLKWASVAMGSRAPLRVGGEIATNKVTSNFFRSLAARHPRHFLVLASVVPKLTPLAQKAFKGRVHIVKAESTGLDFAYPKPAEIGADRLAAAVAVKAAKLYPAIIIACGTATAFTVLDAKGRLCGGAIAPGLQAQLDALLGATAQLPATTLVMPRSPLAKSTRDAIRAGVLLSFQGGVKEIVAQLSKALPGRKKPRLILTGGNAGLVAKSLGLRHTLRPLLVLEGLRIMGQRLCEAAE